MSEVSKVEVETRDLPGELQPTRRAVIVDDHAGFRRCAHELLAAEGFEVVGEAEDGAAAVAAVAECDPDVVLLDVQLPDTDGFELAARLLARDEGLAIVLVSSRDRRDYGTLVEKSGARGFVSKGDLSGATLRGLLG